MSFANTLQQEILTLLPAKRKKSNDWISFNAVCCTHNGESPDTRGRGGMRPNADGSVSYHCFNCGYKAGFYPGRPLGFRFRRLLTWMGADDNTIQRFVFEALRIKEFTPVHEHVKPPEPEVKYKPRPLPEGAISIQALATFVRLGLPYQDDGSVDWKDLMDAVPQDLVDAVSYLHKRKIDIKKYEFYLTDEQAYNLHKRVIIPFTWKDKIIGYSARALVDDVKPKYHNSHDSNYVFNVDKQLPDAKFVFVVEGPFDAMAIDGVAICGGEISPMQAEIIESLDREVIVVPDFDRHIDKRGVEVWPGARLIEQAIEFGWTVSFPLWADECKDAAKCNEEHGKLFTIQSILDGVERNPVKIKLKMRM